MLEVSGMSQFKGRKFLASGLADCDISGMSTASVAAAGSLKYCVSGMSEFNYSGEPVVISTSVDNATVRHRWSTAGPIPVRVYYIVVHPFIADYMNYEWMQYSFNIRYFEVLLLRIFFIFDVVWESLIDYEQIMKDSHEIS